MREFLSELWFSTRVVAVAFVSNKKAREMVSGHPIHEDDINYLKECFSDLWFATKVMFVSLFSGAKARDMVTKHPVREG